MASIPQVKNNIIANLAGKAWACVMGLLFVPVYLKLMGVESYALIGICVSLQALLSVLDMGLSATLSRELARLAVTKGSEQESRDLVRTLEIIYWMVAAVIGVGVAALSPLIVRHWIQPQGIPEGTVAQVLMIIGLVIAIQWPSSLYTGGLLGLQRQVLLNWVCGSISTIQYGGAALLLWLVSPSVLTYFAWLVATSLMQTALLAAFMWSSLPGTCERASFRRRLLHKNWSFAAGMTGISIMVTILTQLDKIILVRMLPLRTFGYYTLAVTVAGALNYLVNPVFVAIYPKFAQLSMDDGCKDGLSSLYHKGCQLISLIVLPAAATLAFFSREVLSLWTRNADTVLNAHLLLSVLVTGMALNALLTLPYALQLAHGWTRLSFYKNVVAVCLLAPLMVLMIKNHGGLGAAMVWVILYSSLILTEIPLMHRRLLKKEMLHWYLYDTGLPVLVSIAVSFVCRLAMPADLPTSLLVLWIAMSGCMSLICVFSVLPSARIWFTRNCPI